MRERPLLLKEEEKTDTLETKGERVDRIEWRKKNSSAKNLL